MQQPVAMPASHQLPVTMLIAAAPAKSHCHRVIIVSFLAGVDGAGGVVVGYNKPRFCASRAARTWRQSTPLFAR